MFRSSRSVSSRFLWLAAPLWVAAVTFAACGGGGGADTAPSAVTVPSTSTTTPATSAGGTTTATNTALAYNQDIKPILDSDCVPCHGSRVHEANVRLDTYADVMRVVTAGSANSLIVRETRPGAQMYVNLTGDRQAKSDLIRAWVVSASAAESR
jgi:hypothetical protein